jgi:photosystem II stability/assembly factor-like uncharacterized protein
MKLWIGTREGLFLASPKNQKTEEWTTEGPFLQEKKLMCLALEPGTGSLYAGFYQEGIFKTTDLGRNWQEIGKGLGGKDVRALAVRPTNPKLVYAGTEPVGLFVSADGGSSWEELLALKEHPAAANWTFPVPPFIPHVRTIEFQYFNRDVVYVGIEVGSVMLSRDRGKTWEEGAPLGRDVHRIIAHYNDPKSLYVATGDDTPPYDGTGGHGVYRSDDQGKSWKQINEGLGERRYCEDAIAVDPNSPSTLYLAAARGVPPYWGVVTTDFVYFLSPSASVRPEGADVGIFRSRNRGESWERLSGGLPDAFFSMVWALEALATNRGTQLFLGTTDGEVFASDDSGETWRKILSGLPAVSHVKGALA